ALLSSMKKMAGSKIKAVGVNSSELTLECFNQIGSAFEGAMFVDVKNAMRKVRAIKDAEEISCIRKACDIASGIYDRVPSLLVEGMTENELAAVIGYEMQRD